MINELFANQVSVWCKTDNEYYTTPVKLIVTQAVCSADSALFHGLITPNSSPFHAGLVV